MILNLNKKLENKRLAHAIASSMAIDVGRLALQHRLKGSKLAMRMLKIVSQDRKAAGRK